MDSPDPTSDPAADSMHARRASSFGAAASAYAQHRPDYPLAAIAWAAEPIAERPGRPIRVLDLGAGTGKLTAQLAGMEIHGEPAEVIAVEPDPGMLAELRRQVQAAGPRPGVTVTAGRAEAIPLPDASVDMVVAGQAAHWFDLDQAMPEIARVLIPGGVFAGLWNADDDRVPWVAGLHQASGRRTVVPVSPSAVRDDDAISAWLRARGLDMFGPLEESVFEHAQSRTAESLIDTLRTHSMFLIMEPDEREAVLSEVRDYLAATPQISSGPFSLPIRTLAIRIPRR
jgi:ubiquinone/menaquinone biosynthesis C-methylase UbiE